MKKYRKIIFTFFLLLLLLGLTLWSETAGIGVQKGLRLSFSSLLPALFPSMVLCGMIGALAEWIPLPASITIWITSHFCGFPLGIRTLVQGYQRGLLTKKQALRLSACCSNASPAFLITYIGKGILGDQRAGLCIFLSQLLLSLFLALILGVFQGPACKEPEDQKLLLIATESITTAAMGSLQLVSYITIFAVMAQLLKNVFFFSYLYPFLELCGGLGSLPLENRFFWVAAAAGFSGLSVMLQNASYLIRAELSSLPMLLGKCFYALVLPPLAIGLNSPKILLLLLFLLPILKALTKCKKRVIINKNQGKERN